MGKNYNHWKKQLGFATEAGDDKYRLHCEEMLKQYIDEEDLEEDDEWDDDTFYDEDGVTIEFYTDRVGQWEIGRGLSKMILPQDEKPKWVHRFFAKQLLGWNWVDTTK